MKPNRAQTGYAEVRKGTEVVMNSARTHASGSGPLQSTSGPANSAWTYAYRSVSPQISGVGLSATGGTGQPGKRASGMAKVENMGPFQHAMPVPGVICSNDSGLVSPDAEECQEPPYGQRSPPAKQDAWGISGGVSHTREAPFPTVTCPCRRSASWPCTDSPKF
jgi:hypothetical protein